MSRKNNKIQTISYENSIKKSNELSMAKLNQGLSLNQMQLLAYAIFSTQQDGKTEFIKADFEKKFGIQKFQTSHAKEDALRILDLKFSIEDLENDSFDFWNVFQSIKYDNGSFRFRWTEDMLPHILELKSKYVITDLTVTSQFKSEFSWVLYDYLKAHYGYWKKAISKSALLHLFDVYDVISYQKNTSLFKKKVLDVAINEINQYTEIETWYTEIKTGNKITDFTLHWSLGEQVLGATDKQLSLLREIHDEVEHNILDYLSLKDFNKLQSAREQIIIIKDINLKVRKGLSSKQASNYIKQAKEHYLTLEKLLELDGQKRDTSFYYNWLEEE